jgi:hypothetical protein
MNNQRVQYQPPKLAESMSGPNPVTKVTEPATNATVAKTTDAKIASDYDLAEVTVLGEVISALVDKKGIEHFIRTVDTKRGAFEDRIKDCIMVAKAAAKLLRES